MTPEEFLNEIRKGEERIKQAEETSEAFLNELTERLVEYVYNWYPEYQTRRSATEKQIASVAEEYAGEVIQLFDSISYHSKKGEPVDKKHTIPKPHSREQSEKELQEILKIIPEKNHEYMKQIHWEDFEEQQHHEGFLFEAHRLMKKILTDYYPNEIMELEADYFRMLDSFLYYLGASMFVDKCYEILE
ncbi:MAG: hypothetical protein ACP5D9_05850 [Mariniphaga sp.]